MYDGKSPDGACEDCTGLMTAPTAAVPPHGNLLRTPRGGVSFDISTYLCAVCNTILMYQPQALRSRWSEVKR